MPEPSQCFRSRFAARITTPRLVLRPLEMADAKPMAALIGPEVARMTGSFCVPYLSLTGEFFILRQPSLERRGLGHHWAILHNGVFAGAIGVVRPSVQSDWEIGYWLGEPFWSRGIASEAVLAVLAEFRSNLPDAELWARVFTDNPASRRVLEKAGWRVTGTEMGHCMERQCDVEGWRLRGPFAGNGVPRHQRRPRMAHQAMEEALG